MRYTQDTLPQLPLRIVQEPAVPASLYNITNNMLVFTMLEVQEMELVSQDFISKGIPQI